MIKKVIFLNAGHSELISEPGAKIPNSVYENEAELNIVIRDFVIPELKEQGFDVVVVPDDKNFRESYLWVNTRAFNINDGLALDIHCNCCGVDGAEVYHYAGYDSSRKKAQKLLEAYCKETGIKNNGVRPDTQSRQGEISWIRETNIWAILIECGYLDSFNDLDFIINNIDKVAKGIAKGICAIYGVVYIESFEPSIDQKKAKALDEIVEVLKKRNLY